MRAVWERGAYANLVLPASIRSAGLTGRDAAFATELTYGTLRGQGTYDRVIAECVDRRLSELDRGVLDVLRLGAHQLFQMAVPVHAAVSTSVELSRSALGSRPSGFVNAVMRRLAARPLADWLAAITRDEPDQLRVLALRHSHPPWIVELLAEALHEPSELEAALSANNRGPRVTLAVRPDKAQVAELVELGGTRTPYSPWGVSWPGGDPGEVPLVKEGRARVQDEGSQLVADVVANTPVEGRDGRWLDLCAGPGGKAALLGGIGHGRGAQVTAVELKEHRAALVRGVVGPNVHVVAEDATRRRWATGDYDRVLVDVPCSGLGALRRRPETRWRRQPADLAKLLPVQQALLDNALRAVRPGGLVGYATCSPAQAETTELVARVTSSRSDIAQLDAREFFPEMPALGDGPAVQLWPHRHGTDAMFLALFPRR